MSTQHRQDTQREYSSALLVGGLLARTWLWFVAGCVVVTLLPMLIGWRPYVVTTGSMEPRIGVGDVVIAAPESDLEALLGRVVVFDDQNVADRITVHRAVEVNDDGTITTRGDANPTPDTAPVPAQDVLGLGRLLVMYVGLPLVWVQSGQWLPLLLLLLSLVVATWFVGRDQELEDDESDTGTDPDADPDADPDGVGDPATAPGTGSAVPAHAPPGALARAVAPLRSALLAADLWPVGATRRPAAPSRHATTPATTTTTAAVAATATATVAATATARTVPPVAGAAGAQRSGGSALVRALQSADLWPVRSPRRAPARSAPVVLALSTLVRRMRPRPLAPVLRVAQVGALGLVLLVPVAGAGFSAATPSVANAWATAASFLNYTGTVQALAPYLYWKLDETGTTSTAADSSGNGRSGSYRTNGGGTYFTKGVAGALTAESPNRAVTQRSTASCIATASTTAVTAPPQVTLIAWFRTTSTQGGKLLGFEQPRTGTAVAGSGGTYDRHLYLDGNGRVWFGVYNDAHITIGSGVGYNDDEWHMAAASFGSTGMRLYVDGVLQGTTTNTGAEATTGWWRAGCGNLAGWGGSWTGPNNPGTATNPTQNRPFAGSLDEITVWNSVLSGTQIADLYATATTP
jgi:signal peptidase I